MDQTHVSDAELQSSVQSKYQMKPVNIKRYEQLPLIMEVVIHKNDLLLHFFWFVDSTRFHDDSYVAWLRKQMIPKWPEDFIQATFRILIDTFNPPKAEKAFLFEWIDELYSQCVTVKNIAAVVHPPEEMIDKMFMDLCRHFQLV